MSIRQSAPKLWLSGAAPTIQQGDLIFVTTVATGSHGNFSLAENSAKFYILHEKLTHFLPNFIHWRCFIGLIQFQTIYALLLQISKCRELRVFGLILLSQKLRLLNLFFLSNIKSANRLCGSELSGHARRLTWITLMHVPSFLPM